MAQQHRAVSLAVTRPLSWMYTGPARLQFLQLICLPLKNWWLLIRVQLNGIERSNPMYCAQLSMVLWRRQNGRWFFYRDSILRGIAKWGRVLQEFLGSETQILPRWGCPARNQNDIFLAMARNWLILVHFGKEFVHFGKTRLAPARKNLTFSCQP